jgi:tRNA (cmo5U34)-methyltransferase
VYSSFIPYTYIAGGEVVTKSDTSWNDKTAHSYEKAIAKKIPGYHILFDLVGNLYSTMDSVSKFPELLVIGAGGGQDIITLGKKDKNIRFTGIDPLLEMLNLAQFRFQKEQLENEIELVHGTIDSLSNNKQFDVAVCMLVLHFVKGRENKKELLQRIYQHLKPGATLFLSTIYTLEDKKSVSVLIQAWKNHMLQNDISIEEWNRFEAAIGTEFDFITESMLLQLLEECGFKEITSFFSSLLVKGYVVKK